MFTEQEETVVDSAETTTQDEVNDTDNETNSTGEGEGEAQTKEGVEHKPETPEQRVARLERQLEQARKKAGLTTEKGSKEGSKEEVADERYLRLELKTDGITSKKEQDIVIEYANWKKIDVSEALKSPSVKAELAEYRAKANVPAPSTRTGTGANNSLEYWIGQAKKGNFPRNDKAMMKQIEKARIFTS